jgi:hypothetical protein
MRCPSFRRNKKGFHPATSPHIMNHEANKLSGAADLPTNDPPVSARAMWRREGAFIVDGTGKKIAQMRDAPAEHELHQRRILAALNALRDIPTQFIEELLDECPDNFILGLITHDREMAATLQQMEERIATHCREIEQLREMMDACRVFEEQRALLQQAPGSAEYEGLLRALGIR